LAKADWGYSRQMQAIDLLSASLGEFQAAGGGVLPVSANGPLGTLVDFLEQRRHYGRGETVLLEQLKHPAHPQQAMWLTQRLYQLYEDALRHGGDVTLGSGAVLYTAVEKQIRADLDTNDQNHRRQLLSRLCGIYRVASTRRGQLSSRPGGSVTNSSRLSQAPSGAPWP
jgi:hypothetical protein